MPLQKQALHINFGQGLDTKSDPFQVPMGRFLTLQNSVFDKAGRLTKRNGYGMLTPLPDTTSKFVTTFNGNLTAIGTSLRALSSSTDQWVTKGSLLPISVNTLPLVRSNTSQVQGDAAVAANGLVCTVYTDTGGAVTPVYKYVVANSITGQNVVAPTSLNADATFGTPRVFILGNYFIILFTTHPAAYHIQYIAISISNPTTVTAATDITNSYIPATTVAFDALTVNNKLYIAYNTTSGGQSIKVTYLAQTLGNPVTAATFAGEIATMFTLAADLTTPSNPIIYVSYYNLPTTTGKTLAVNSNLSTVLAPTTMITATTVRNLASTAQNAVCTLFYEVAAVYAYMPSTATNFIRSRTITQAGVTGTAAIVARSVGLASKAILRNSIPYFLAVYNSDFQPTYFLMNASGQVISKLAYSNAGPYDTTGLPGVTLIADTLYIAYLFKDLVEAINANDTTSTSPVYAQLGVNLVSFDFGVGIISSAEIGNNLNISGGFITAYDGFEPVEQEFFLWPDYVNTTAHASGGSQTDQQYYYQVTYEWADNQGNLFRSAASLPASSLISGGGGAGSTTVHIPTLRLTYKLTNPVKLSVYRWSTAQQTYYQVTSITTPVLNDTTVDYIDYLDIKSDAQIIGNNILYTTGGVLENIAPPASDLLTLFNNRLWLVSAEDRNLLWYSKQVIEATPVEMSDLLTIYVAPTTASQTSTGPITAIAPMDDKLIVFKRDASGFINGIGPDNTGANSSYSDFILSSSTVGCSNQQSIVLIPSGLMFQSDKGIWLLGRDLSSQYIGAAVESLTTGATVQSAVSVPGTNQVRFTLDTGVTLMYDYFYNQWGTFVNVPSISSTIYQTLHTYINDLGQVFQETPDTYIDNTSPVLMSFTSSWMNLAGVQGFERFYQMYLLGQYITPFKLNVQLAYDYNGSSTQSYMVTPNNIFSTWGSSPVWGAGEVWGGTSAVFEARIFPQIQKCESFQISINEIYDSTQGVAAGQGLTLSGMNLVVGMKKGYRTSSAAKSFG